MVVMMILIHQGLSVLIALLLRTMIIIVVIICPTLVVGLVKLIEVGSRTFGVDG